MPRSRPGALRPAHDPRPCTRSLPPPDRIHGLSSRTSLAIHRLELLTPGLHLGAVDYALRRYEEFLRPPGRRPLYPRMADCDCHWHAFDDVRHARDILEEALEHLPPRPRAELNRQVRRLDTEFHARTLPDPFADRRTWRVDRWWHRRLWEWGEWR
ncbi:hypothetical protein SGFS_056930 [Streptomyces graminofaciens]|uniref:Uncharacterized protein n=1 Tax=Streptomyces graminofaciens TaxID=68212 RepID=A0ABM7FE41_9ACTN|nr:hypothetical protein [Streptomyces graminofaciens]BBC34399.1 hypothetical protein SGFS_056930 [Streptomyces graminofaciens]